MQTVTAKSLILDLLRTSKPSALPVRLLINTAAIFDISENAMRVNLNRLIKRDVISQDSRGYYQVSETTSPLRTWVASWRAGEQRIRPWQQQWLNLQISSSLNASAAKQLQRAAFRFGFRQYWDNSWIRPDNLSINNADLSQLLEQLSEQNSFMLMQVQQFSGNKKPAQLWQPEKVEQVYRSHITALQDSINNIDSAELASRFRDSFILGGNCIHTLAIDPLLPAELINVELRDELTQLMKTYDRMCTPYWQQLFSQYKFANSPAHLEPKLSQPLALI